MALLLVGCGGGGGDDPVLALTTLPDFTTASDRATLSGTLSLPAGSERLGGTPTVPWVTCSLGQHTMTWRNAANGATGTPFAMWDCPKDFAFWSAAGIPLAAGANPITVTFSDATGQASATTVVTRN